LENYIRDRQSGTADHVRRILKKLTVVQLEYLSHPVLFDTGSGGANAESRTMIKKKMAVYLAGHLESKNPRMISELMQVDAEDLKMLKKIFRRYDRDHSFRDRMIDLITEHPYFSEYGLLNLLAGMSIESEDGQRALAGMQVGQKMPDSSVVQGLKDAQSDVQNAIRQLPKKHILALHESISTGTLASPAARKMITGLLKKLTDQSLYVISGLTRLNKNEIEKLASVQPAQSALSTDSIKTIIGNSGLSIMASYLPSFFNHLGFTEQGKFRTKTYAYRAAYVLEYIVNGRQRNYEYTMQLNKLLCGLKSDESLPAYKRLTRSEMNEAEELIASIVRNWKALKSTSSKGFRSSFLQRKGILTE
jgi:hypothetical protein